MAKSSLKRNFRDFKVTIKMRVKNLLFIKKISSKNIPDFISVMKDLEKVNKFITFPQRKEIQETTHLL